MNGPRRFRINYLQNGAFPHPAGQADPAILGYSWRDGGLPVAGQGRCLGSARRTDRLGAVTHQHRHPVSPPAAS
jgi:hypothetical protein